MKADLDELARTIHETWGNADSLSFMAPSVADDPASRTWFSGVQRLGASPGAFVALERMNAAIDIRHVLPTISVPTLVLHRLDTLNYRVEEGRYVAAHIHGARLIELPGIDYIHHVGDADALIDDIEAFVTGKRPNATPDHVLATVLTIDIDWAASKAVALGDQRWADAQERFQTLAEREFGQFRGRALDVAGDRVTATFDGPGRAIHCAAAVRAAGNALGLQTRAGLRTGECELRGEKVSGVAVPLAGWIAAQAIPDEILVSSTVKDLLAGADTRFSDRGSRELPGVPGAWRLFAVLTDAGAAGQAGPALSSFSPLALTRREWEVLPLVVRGMSNRQIADALSISERTAESHVASILAKSGLSSRGQLAARTAHIDPQTPRT